MRFLHLSSLLVAIFVPVAIGCGDDDGGTDTSPDVTGDVGVDSAMDSATDGMVDASVDGTTDGMVDSGTTTDADVGEEDTFPPLDTAPADTFTPGCAQWSLVTAPIRNIRALDPSPLAGRAVQIAFETDVQDCEEPAQPGVNVLAGPRSVDLEARAWRRSDVVCTASSTMTRYVVVNLLPGTWSLADADDPDPEIMITVSEAPERSCDVTRDVCELDCDCLDGRCLTDGTVTKCARSCDLNRDCGGGRCVDDGALRICDFEQDECESSADCEAGFRCRSGSCNVEFVLNSSSRVPCTCDSECDTGLSCVSGNCEARCRSGALFESEWCSGSHWCATPGSDVSGLSSTEAVCGWVGD